MSDQGHSFPKELIANEPTVMKIPRVSVPAYLVITWPSALNRLCRKRTS